MLRRVSRKDRHPSCWWGYCWSEDYANVHVFAPLGMHLLLTFARWAYRWIEYRTSLAIDIDPPSQERTKRWPLAIWVPGDELAQRSWYGLCWGEGDDRSWGRYIAPIGLNLVYAVVRGALVRLR